ncbi:hypothetical protein SAMN04488700_1982 [Carnobacterium iners]|uniref:Uncharacterized protein n=1 Tax=Carnobacterium iners TaxID=1073423 RepID=A0A1X7NHK3_9LACT|nr:hypothetical protein [Carnobacterium iners]SEK64511.1 hypothetical protein SAMN04488114_10812 [Carnobacterium iners]SMH37307.1 hypothetical protein SAMN04488700_1982 [Carnobacterium iners]
MGQFFKSDTSIDELFSKFALDPEEAPSAKEKTDKEVDKNKINPDKKNK